MIKEERNVKLAILTPSYINSNLRSKYAKTCFDSIQVLSTYDHIIINDVHPFSKYVPKSIKSLIAPFKYNQMAENIYMGQNITLINRIRDGSASALLDGVLYARKLKAKYVFINLDDHIYIPQIADLVKHSIDAFSCNNSLLMVRFSGYPLIYNDKIPIVCREDKIKFDSISLIPTRKHDYTLWAATFSQNSIDNNYWPIALWFCIYQVDFLEKILTFCDINKYKSLGLVESFYKKPANWKRLLDEVSGQFGYINMQFGGFEMHRNKNWKNMINEPNEPIY